jgi:hypothetical protein
MAGEYSWKIEVSLLTRAVCEPSPAIMARLPYLEILKTRSLS